MIKTVILRNFKCFEDLVLPIGNLTLLTGLNGAGKSSVIQALLILRQTSTADSFSVPYERLLLNGELVSIGTGRDALYDNAQVDSLSIGVGWVSREWDIKTKGSSTVAKNCYLTFDYLQDRDQLLLDQEEQVLDETEEQVLDETEELLTYLTTRPFQYIKADRIGPKTAYPMARHQNKDVRDYFLGTQGEYAPYFLTAFGNRKIAIPALCHPTETSLRFDLQTSAWMQEISPGVRIETTTFSDMDVVNLQYSFERQGEVSNAFRAGNVGFGITYTLPTVLALLTARRGSLIILENPEAHLHPRGQSHMAKLISLAAANGVQVIVETHSDHVLNGIRVAVHSGLLTPESVKIHFFQSSRRAGAPAVVESPEIDRNGRLDFWPEGFFDEMDRSLEILLTPAGDTHADRSNPE